MPPLLQASKPKKGKKSKPKRELLSPVPSEKSSIKSNYVIAKEGEPIRVQVLILSVISPGCFHVRLCDRNEELLDLEVEMGNFYRPRPHDPNQKWDINDKCAVNIDNKWYRAIIEQIEEEEENPKNIKVFIKDTALTENVKKTQLRVLHNKFMVVRDGSIKCQMFGIKAAGDGKTWPMLACEELRDILNNYADIYITKRGEIENRTLPVDVWVQHTTPGGALEASITEWIKVNDMLVEKGLVIPDREIREVKEVELTRIDAITDWLEIAELETGSGFNVNETWLPCEPPKKPIFTGVVTHVDDDLNIYLHDQNLEGTLGTIKQTLKFNFMDSKPTNEDMFWSGDQPCIAKDIESGE